MPGILKSQIQPQDATIFKHSKPSILNRKIQFINSSSSSTPSAQTSNFKYSQNINASSNNLILSWKSPSQIGPGLVNVGNTCFLNSVLQVITYTPPFAQYLLAKSHECVSKSSCTLNALQEHVIKCLSASPERSICPKNILSKLKLIAKQFKLGRQEDSHEFMLYLFESLQKSCIGKDAPKSLGIIHEIFGGSIQSQVKCQSCNTESNTIDPVYDLSLDIKNCDSLEKALSFYTKPETLSGSNRYRCQHCKKMVEAQKRISIHENPNVLAIQLKRFGFTKFGSKVNRRISFNDTLDLGNYMTDKKNGEKYTLFGVLVHAGQSCNSGHYYSYVKNSNGIWYCMNDSDVSQVSLKTVLEQSAYMLYYVKVDDKIRKDTKKNINVQSKKPISESLLNDTEILAPLISPKSNIDKKSIYNNQKSSHISEKPIEKVSKNPIAKVECQKVVSKKDHVIASVKSNTLEVVQVAKEIEKHEKLLDIPKTNLKANATCKWVVKKYKEWNSGSDTKPILSDTHQPAKMQVKKKEIARSSSNVKETLVIAPKSEKAYSSISSQSPFLKQDLSIETWEGGDVSSNFIGKKGRKRASRDDMEYDLGKTKKVKKEKRQK